MNDTIYIDSATAAQLTGKSKQAICKNVRLGALDAESTDETGRGGVGGISYRIPLTALPAEAQIKYLRATVMRDMEGSRYEFDLAGYKVRKGDAGLKILLERQEAVIAFHVLQRDGKGKLKERIDALAAQYGVSGMTLRRWARGYAENGLGGLVREGRSDKGKSRTMCDEARRYICEQYLSPEQRTQALIRDKLEDRIRELGPMGCENCPYNPESANHLALIGTEDEPFFPPCGQAGHGILMTGGREAVRRVVASISDAEKTYMRKGRKVWEAAYMVKATRAKPEMVNEAWYGDHHQFDVFVLDAQGKPVRPWLTAWYDIGSGCMAGWCISTNPNSETILEAFARGAARKKNSPFHGIPRYCYIDNGKDYRGQRFEGGELRDYEMKGLNANLNEQGLMQALCIEVIHAKPYHGWAKPVERWFRTLEERYCRDLPGYCAGKPENRPENFERSLKQLTERGELLTLDELGDIFLNEILPAYHNRAHDGYGGETPMERYLRLPRARAEEIGWNTLAIIKKEAAHRVVSTQGVKFDGRLYWHPELRFLVRQEVTLRYNRGDWRSVSIFDREGRFVCEAEPKELLKMVGENEETVAEHMALQKRQETETRRTIRSRGVRLPGKRASGNMLYECVDESYRGTLDSFEAERAARGFADSRNRRKAHEERTAEGANAVRQMFRSAGDDLLRRAKSM